MPLYIYRCSVCGREVEELQKMGETTPPAVDCPQGDTCNLSKTITNAAFKFIGEGWGGWIGDASGSVSRQTNNKVHTLAPKKKKKRPVAEPAPSTTATAPVPVEKPKDKVGSAV